MKTNLMIILVGMLLFFTGGCNKQEVLQDDGTSVVTTLKSGSLPLKEAESLAATTSGQHTAEVFAEAGASGGSNSLLQSTAVNEWIQYTINIATAGTYNVKVMLCKYDSRGIGRLTIDGVVKGTDQDLYKAAPYGYAIVDYGNTTLSAGNHLFRFTVVGKNASASSWKMSFDYIDLTPVGAVIYEAESLAATTSGQHTAEVFAEAGASGGSNSLLQSTAVNEWIQYTINIATAGTYNVEVMLCKYDSRGIGRLTIDGVVKGTDQDLYKAAPYGYTLTGMGSTTLTAGNHLFRFTVVGKNASASSWKLSFDYIKLTSSGGVSMPTLAATTAASAITQTTATSGGNVTSDGGASVTARGVCWSTSVNPTTANPKTTNGTGTGTFTSSITGLSAGTLYYVRAYATNSAGTGYGTQISFTTTAAGGTILETDHRTLSWIDPRKTWASYSGSAHLYQIDDNYSAHALADIPSHGSTLGYEARIGGVRQAGVFTLKLDTDPANGAKKAFYHKVSSNWDKFSGSTSRSEFDGGIVQSDVMIEGVEYWVATAYYFTADCFGHNGTNIDLGDIHEQNYSPETPGAVIGSVMNGMFLGDNAGIYPMLWGYQWSTAYPPVWGGSGWGEITSTLQTSAEMTSGVWYYVIRKVKLHYNTSNSPYLKGWVAKGTGALTSKVDYSGPTAVNLDNPRYFPKIGLYKWDQNWGSKTTRTMYCKGLFVFKAEAPGGGEPVIDQNSLLTFLKSF